MVGKRVQQLRLERKMSLTELSERAGVSKSYLSTIERDIQSNPSIQFLEKLAAVLNVPVESFLNDDDQENHEDSITELDNEWYALVLEAMESGVSKEQFREFLEFNRWRLNQEKNNDNDK